MLAVLFAEEAAAGTEITVSAALSLKAPFEEIGRSYEKKHPGSKVVFNFAASGLLQKQIEAGAPADVFASASSKEMDALKAAGLLLETSRADFSGNKIVLIAAKNASVRISSFSDLKKSDVVRLAIGNPATVPAGKYAEETLRTLGLWNDLKSKLVYAENVRQVMDYVERNEADAGMVFLTDANVRDRELKVIAEAPASSHSPVKYEIAAIKGTKNEAAARNFISIVISREGSDILRRYGFKMAPHPALSPR
ncbi:MAG: molybdate ABC transporter substrate-binding protein [Nitrospirae bacterium]|nr:molybdate ABC transporter substrate-binding protein [Nitrospirota bacterium]